MPKTDRELTIARALARILDNAVRIPGTSYRIGLDPLLGLFPGLGDALGGALSGYLILLAGRLGAPPSVLLRMLGNLAIDSLVGIVPFFGDLFDVAWKANARNLALLERYLEHPPRTKRTSRALVALILSAVLLLLFGTILVTFVLARWLVDGA